MIKEVIILGTGGNSVDILDIILDINKIKQKYNCVGFLDDNPEKHNEIISGVRVVGRLEDAEKYPDCFFVNGIGNSLNFFKKEKIINKTKLDNDRFLTLVHPSASISTMADIKPGTVIFPNVTVNSNVKIGHHVMILSSSIISHDCSVGDFTAIAGGVCMSGNITIGSFCYVGSNVAIKENTEIGKYCLIGIGSTVLKNVKEGNVVVGNPAKILKKLKVD